MAKNTKNQVAAVAEANVELNVTNQTVMDVELTVEKRKRGRPVGSGINPESARQKRLAELAERIASGEVIKRGRPAGTVNPDSKRQQRIAELNAKKAMGLGKPGRPKVVKSDDAVEVVVEG
jgi:hypothetical protein